VSTSHTISLPVDALNPGQFFACCGLLELAGRLWQDAEGCFAEDSFTIHADMSLSDLLEAFRGCPVVDDQSSVGADRVGGEVAEDDEDRAGSIDLGDPVHLRLDWWSDKSIKPWAGSMDARRIFAGMKSAIDASTNDPFNDLRVVYDPAAVGSRARPKKREPFYFDSRRGGSARSLDIGFAPDALDMLSAACPAVEALCLVGLQRFRPMPTGSPRVHEYCTWRTPLPAPVAGAAACGVLPAVGAARYRFENAFRTDQRKHKGFLPARLLPEIHGDTP
jgi:CRISPR-associated protein Csb3